jgi:hypothetical protein
LGGTRRESLLNPCGEGEFADSGRNLTNQAVYREKSLLNSLGQGKRLNPRRKRNGERGRNPIKEDVKKQILSVPSVSRCM